jgi:hypothetical protein
VTAATALGNTIQIAWDPENAREAWYNKYLFRSFVLFFSTNEIFCDTIEQTIGGLQSSDRPGFFHQ